MPLSPSVFTTGFIAPNLAAVAHIGQGMPKFAKGVASGVTFYLTGTAKVTSIDTGTLGVGATLMPLIIPSPLIQTGLTTGFQAKDVFGPMAPLTITGLTNGITAGLAALALLTLTHPTVGVGAGVARITGPSAVPPMIAGFAAAGMTSDGSVRMATAIGIGLDTVFQTFVTPIPIVGPAAPLPSGGTGFGTVI